MQRPAHMRFERLFRASTKVCWLWCLARTRWWRWLADCKRCTKTSSSCTPPGTERNWSLRIRWNAKKAKKYGTTDVGTYLSSSSVHTCESKRVDSQRWWEKARILARKWALCVDVELEDDDNGSTEAVASTCSIGRVEVGGVRPLDRKLWGQITIGKNGLRHNSEQ